MVIIELKLTYLTDRLVNHHINCMYVSEHINSIWSFGGVKGKLDNEFNMTASVLYSNTNILIPIFLFRSFKIKMIKIM